MADTIKDICLGHSDVTTNVCPHGLRGTLPTACWDAASLLSGMDLTSQQSALCELIYSEKNKWGGSEVYCPQIEQASKWKFVIKTGKVVTDRMSYGG